VLVFFESAKVLKEFVAHRVMVDLKGFAKVALHTHVLHIDAP
jgi:hypothetical protein